MKDNALIQVNNQDSLFEIGSITKTFTATVLANCVVNKSIKLKHKINPHFPYALKDNIELSYCALANHTSGLYRLPFNIMPFVYQNPDNPYSEYSYQMLDDYLQNDLALNNRKIDKYDYSNLGAGLLAYALAKQQQTNFESLVQKHITDSYQMNSTAYAREVSYAGLGADGLTTSNWQFNAMKGAGGLISSTNDLSKFILAHFRQKRQSTRTHPKRNFQNQRRFCHRARLAHPKGQHSK